MQRSVFTNKRVSPLNKNALDVPKPTLIPMPIKCVVRNTQAHYPGMHAGFRFATYNPLP